MAGQETSQARRRRWPWILAGAAGGVVGLGLLARGLAATSIGRGFVEQRLEAAAPAGQEIELDGLEGDLLGRFTASRLTVADAEGVWLTAEDIRIDWSPWALTGRRLVVEEVALGMLDIARQPQLETESQDREDGGGGNPLRGGRLGSLSIDRLRTGAALTGEAATFSAAASADFGASGWTLETRLVPEAADGDRIRIDLAWPDGGVLSGEAELTAPAGGLIASLARLEEGQSMQVNAEASGGREDWQLSARALVDGAPALTADLSGEDGRLGGTASADLSRHPLTRPVGQRIGSDLDATLSQVEREGRPRLSLQARTERLTTVVSTDADRNEGPIAVVASLDGLGEALDVDGVDADLVRIALLTRQSPGDWSIDGDITLDTVATPLGPLDRLAGPFRLGLGDDSPSLSLTLSAAGAALEGPAGALLGPSPTLRLEAGRAADGERLLLDRLQLSGAHAALSASGRYDPPDNALRLSGDMRVDGRAADALPFDLAGSWQTAPGEGGRPEIGFAGEATGFDTLPADLAPLVGDTVRLDLTARPEADGGLALPALSLTAAGISVEGSAARAGDGTLIARLDGRIGAWDSAGASLAPLRLDLAVSGPQDALDIDLTADTDEVAVSGQAFANARLELDGALADLGAFSGRLNARADSDTGPLTLDTALDLSAERVRLSGLSADAFGLSARGDATAPFAAPSELTADLTLSGTPRLDIPLDRIDVRAIINEARLDLDATADLAAIGALDPGQLRLDVSGTPEAATITGAFESAVDLQGRRQPVALDLTGNLAGLGETRTRLELSPELTLGDIRAETLEPVTLRRDTEAGTLDASGALGLLGGRAEASFTAGPDRTRLEASYGDLAIAPVLALLQRPVVGGELSGEITVETGTGPDNARIAASGSLAGLAPAGQPANPVTLDYALKGDSNGLVGDLTARDNEGLDLTARLEAPIEPATGWPGLSLATDGGARYTVNGSGNVEALTALALPPSVALSGDVAIDLSGEIPGIEGSTTGQVEISGGRIEHGDLGFLLTGLDALTRIEGGRFTLERLDAEGPEGGTLSGRGTYDLGGEGSNLALEARDLFVVDRQDVRARGSGTLSLDETDEGYAITGDITIDRADIDPSQIQGTGYQTLDITFANGEAEPPEAEIDETTRLALDISLEAPRRVFVSGMGLDAEFSLSASITGPAGNPAIDGEARIVRGRFDFAGKRFVFQESSVRLAGDPSRAELDLRAVREANDIRAVITITGTPDSPEIGLSSEPELPEDEILSRILFGRSPSELSELEALQLASSLASLTGSGGGLDILGDIESALGLDSLDLGPGAGGGTSVTSGKYLAENVYLQVRTEGIGQPALIIEWTPRENLEVETGLTPGEGQGVSIQWQLEFD